MRSSDPKVERERRLRARESHRVGKLQVREMGPEDRFTKKGGRKGNTVQNFVKPAHQPGDTQPVFGEDVVVFKGGEGGRGWTVRSTMW